jgi:type I restriction enzyme S subunit
VVGNHNNELLEGFKMTELGLLPRDWEIGELGEVADYINGYGFGPSEWSKYGRPIIRIQNLTGSSANINYYDGEIDHRYLVKPGDLLISWSASLGAFIWRGEEAWVNQHIFKVANLNKQVDKYYLFYIINDHIERIKSKTRGSTMKHFTRKEFLVTKIPLPPPPEQRAIAHVLSTIRQAIEAQDKIIAAARELKKSLMCHLFTYGPVPVAEAEKVLLKETEIGPVPAHWHAVKLGDVIDKPEYGYTATASSEIIGPKFLRITDIQNNGVDWVSVPYCECSPVEEGKYRLQSGDILFARIGATTGKTYLIKDSPPAIFASYLIRVRCKSSLLPDYLGQFTTSKQYWNQINASKGGRLKQGINIPVLKSLLVPFPSLPEQQKIALMLSSVDKKTETEENRKAALQTLFKTMLDQLMTGKTRVKDLETTAA